MFRTIPLGVAFLISLFAWSVRAADPPADPAPLPRSVAETPAEAEIEAVLRRPTTIEWEEETLTDAVDKLAEQHGIEIRLDQKALIEAGIDPSVLVTFNTRKPTPLAHALDWLEDLELTYLVSRDELLITSKERAEGFSTTRVYPVHDLINESDRSPSQFSSFLDHKIILAPSGWAIVHSGNRQSHAELTEILAEIRGAKEPRRASPDAEIEAALKKQVMIDLERESLADAIEKIAAQAGMEFRLDQKALSEAGIDSSISVTFKTRRPITLSAALDLMLDDYELTHVIHHGAVRVTSKEKADDMLVWRAYPVEDLVEILPGRQSNVGPLIQMIEDEVAPDSWGPNGGIGTIRPFRAPWGMVLVFPNTRRVHAEVAALLAELRAVKQTSDAPPRAKRDPKAPYLVVYRLGDVSGPETIKAVTSAIAPTTWQAGGGAGQVWAVPTIAATSGGFTSAKEKDDASQPRSRQWCLIVSQTADVHQQLGVLLAKLTGRNGSAGLGAADGIIESIQAASASPKASSDADAPKAQPPEDAK